MFKPGTAPSRPATADQLRSLLDRYRVIMDLNMPGLHAEDLTVSGNAFYGCNFAETRLEGGVVERCTFELCFFQFSTLANVTFTDVKMSNCVFGGSRISETTFRGSNVVQCNFNGVRARMLVFDDCDLLHTRFDNAQLQLVHFENCNLKETRFLRSDIHEVSFRYANQEDAVFVEEENW
ncbi:MAG: pentapeptide repeat-containing protein [Spirochaetales bacterium]